MTHARTLVFLLVAGSVAACSPSPAPDVVDAATADVRPDAPEDVVMDAGCMLPPDAPPPADPPFLFGPCRRDADCPSGDVCLTQQEDGWPGGFCTRPCTTDASCETGMEGVYSTCRMVGMRQLCMRECLNGYSCEREGYTCAPVSQTQNICVPSCTAETCENCQACNAWTSRCVAPETLPPPGRDNGEPCTRDGEGSECRSSLCIEATTSTGVHTGWNGGACVSNCALPQGYNPSNLWAPDEFPQSNCPSGSICFPNGDGLAERDSGICLDECRSDNDCRVAEGYFCRRTFQVARNRSRTWRNGYCAPIDCQARECPTGYTCEVQTRGAGGQTFRVGVCRPAEMPDGGAPDASDAGEDTLVLPTDAGLDDGSTSDGGSDLDGASD